MPDFPDTTTWTLEAVRLDQTGIHPLRDGMPSIEWSAVRRVALGFEIHPFVTADYHFWAFQLGDPRAMYRVVTTLDDPLTTEVRRRYGSPDIPPIRKWRDAGRSVVTWVVWPDEDRGKSLYAYRKRHWWAWKTHVVHALP